tara:strand:+ start:650 stop:2389 length:1740 start_codon:yes stop_codon:yes gene_type:complete
MKLTSLYLALVAVGLLSSSARAQPNIIIVMPDDMGYGDLGVTGNPVIRTPNLDRFASESAELTNFYVSPVCSPTRASLMTGRYNYRTRCIDTFKGRSMMEPEEVTIAETLREAGYATGIFGKWHLGDNYPLRAQDQGFDEALIHRGGGLAQPSEPIENNQRYTDPILIHNGEQVQSKGYCTDIYFDAAIDFMKQSNAAGKPFFVYLPPNAPHGPYHDVPEELLAYYQSIDLTPALAGGTSDKHKDTVARVYAMVENIDQNFGKLDAFLEDSDLKKDTLVMFFTDNGPNTMRFVGDFRGMKSHVHDGGIHTMFYARWPEHIQAGTKSDRIAAHIDIHPTVIDAAGVSAPEGVKHDGVSLLPLLGAKKGKWADRALFLQSHRGDEPVPFHHFAMRTQDWKLLRPTGFGNESVKEDIPFELYRVSNDVGESKNLAEEMPEKLTEMKAAYQAWFEDVSSTRPDNYAPPRIVIGSDKETVTDLSIQDWRVSSSDGWGTAGKWMVEIVDEGPYKARVQWDHVIGRREVTLHVGEINFEGVLESDATEVVFSDLHFPKGETFFSVSVGGEVERGDVLRFLTIEKTK